MNIPGFVHVPPLFVLLCLFCGWGCITGNIRWLYYKYQNPKSGLSLVSSIQMHIFFGLITTATISVIYSTGQGASWMQILPELLILLVSAIVAYNKVIPAHSHIKIQLNTLWLITYRSLQRIFVQICTLGLFLALVWGLYKTGSLINNLSGHFIVKPAQISVFGSAALILGPSLYAFSNLRKRQKRLYPDEWPVTRSALVWPFVLAVFFFLLPVLLEIILAKGRLQELWERSWPLIIV